MVGSGARTTRQSATSSSRRTAGRVGLSNIVAIDPSHGTAEWGFYIGAEDAPQGSGSVMEFLTLEEAFGPLQIRKLTCEVLAFNERPLKMHRKFGFVQEGVLRAHKLHDGTYEDVVQLALFADEWPRHSRAVGADRVQGIADARDSHSRPHRRSLGAAARHRRDERQPQPLASNARSRSWTRRRTPGRTRSRSRPTRPTRITLDVERDEFLINDPDSLWAGRSLHSLYEEASHAVGVARGDLRSCQAQRG